MPTCQPTNVSEAKAKVTNTSEAITSPNGFSSGMPKNTAAVARLMRPMLTTPGSLTVCMIPKNAVTKPAMTAATLSTRCCRETDSAQCWLRADGRRCMRSQSDRRPSGGTGPAHFRLVPTGED